MFTSGFFWSRICWNMNLSGNFWKCLDMWFFLLEAEGQGSFLGTIYPIMAQTCQTSSPSVLLPEMMVFIAAGDVRLWCSDSVMKTDHVPQWMLWFFCSWVAVATYCLDSVVIPLTFSSAEILQLDSSHILLWYHSEAPRELRVTRSFKNVVSPYALVLDFTHLWPEKLLDHLNLRIWMRVL